MSTLLLPELKQLHSNCKHELPAEKVKGTAGKEERTLDVRGALTVLNFTGG